jgi:hypothetical protein
MKLATLEKKNSRIPHINNRTVLHNGTRYRLRFSSFSGMVFADAEPMPKGDTISLFAQTKLSKELRNRIEMGLIS